MSSVLNDLIDNLNKQIDNLEQFEHLLGNQQDVLIRNDVDHLKESLNEQNQLISSAKNLENRRKVIVDNYRKEIGEENQDLTLSEICEKTDGTLSEQLKKLRETLLNSSNKVNRLREQNEMLVNQSMEIINGTMKIIYNTDERGKPSYNAGCNRPTASGPSRLVLNKVI
ncbi:MAG: flagellar protein FlgN [candidate division Zixibacteria bacterium]|nr:flagellar protein FlgN [candidate division Zixibacteria bacterium]